MLTVSSTFGYFGSIPLPHPVQKMNIDVHLLDTEAHNTIARPWHIEGWV